MNTPSKKTKVATENCVDEDISEEYSENDSESDESIPNEDMGEVNVEFAAYSPEDDDFEGIKNLLIQLFLKLEINTSELAKLLLENRQFCSVMKQDVDPESGNEDSDDEDPVFGVTSLIPLHQNFEKPCIVQIRSVFENRISKSNEIRRLISDPNSKIAFVINERYVNLPPVISLHCYKQLMTDINSEENKTLKFDWFLLISKVLRPKPSNPHEKDDIYSNAEDEIFEEFSKEKFEFSVANLTDPEALGGSWKDDENLYEPLRKILLLSHSDWLLALKKLEEIFK